MKLNKLVIAAVAVAAVLSAGLAQARDRSDVQWSITIGSPAPVRVYAPPVQVYSPPLRVYAPPVQVYAPPVRVYGPPALVIDNRGYQRPSADRGRGWVRVRDRDRDGIPDRYDRVYNPHWDRDGDGIPNRYDRRPNRPR